MAAEFEEMLQMSGGFGRYQWFLYIFYMSVMFVMAAQDGFMIFGKMGPEDKELCHFRNHSWYNEIAVTNETACSEEIRFYSVTMEFGLFGNLFWVQGFMISIQYAPMMLSALVSGQVSDRFGRKPAFVTCFVLLILVSVAGSFSPNWQTFVFIRFLIGGLLPAVYGPLSVLCSESVPQNWRYFMSMGIWTCGFSFVALLAYIFRNWRYLLIATNMTAPVALSFVYWIRESPKWLIERGRYSEAIDVFQTIGKWNRVQNWDQDSIYLVELKLKTMKQNRQALNEKQAFLTYWHLFYNWKATKVLVTIIVTRCITLGAYYGLLFNTGKLAGDVSLNLFLIMLISYCINFIPFLVDKYFHKVGRRHLFFLGITIAWLCMGYSVVAYATSLWERIPIVLNITSFVGIGFLMVANNVINDLSLIETTPTLLRSMGDSLVTCLTRIGAILGPQIILLFNLWKAGPSLVFLIEITFASLLVYFILPETKGKPLPDLPPKFNQKLNYTSAGSNMNVEANVLIS